MGRPPRALGCELTQRGYPPIAPESVAGGRRHARALLLVEADPALLLQKLFGALLTGHSVLLGDPGWPAARLEQARALGAALPVRPRSPEILIPTGGTTGGLRFARHRWSTLATAAEGFLKAFGPEACATRVVLPLHHVSGLMPVLRALGAGAPFALDRYADWKTGRLPEAGGGGLSLVPTQLSQLLALDGGADWLHTRWHMLLIGGAALPQGLCRQARELQLPLAPCYGMTETAAAVTVLKPGDFLAGVEGVGEALPHVRLKPVPGERLQIRSRALCHGHWPAQPQFRRRPFSPGDRVVPQAGHPGHWRVLGRLDALIISGGEKVDPARVQAALEADPGVDEALVWGEDDPHWGQRVAAAVAPALGEAAAEALQARLASVLSPHERPKRLKSYAVLPRTGAGKPDWGALRGGDPS